MNITCDSGEKCQAGFADSHCGIMRLLAKCSHGGRDIHKGCFRDLIDF